MPNASAPKAPCVDVCESPHTMVMPGIVRPSCGPTTCTTPWSASPRVWMRTPNSSGVVAQRVDLDARGLVRDRQVDVERGGVVVLGRDGEVRAAHGAAGEAQALKGLRARDLVTHVEVDVDEVGSAVVALAHQVVVPQLLGERRAHACSFFPNYSC